MAIIWSKSGRGGVKEALVVENMSAIRSRQMTEEGKNQIVQACELNACWSRRQKIAVKG